MPKEYDVVILGGGTGGYVAAIRAAQLGLTVAIVEKEKVGGTCLHAGCIPTKALLKSAQMWRQAHALSQYGIVASHLSFNMQLAQQRKADIMEQLYTGVQQLLKKWSIPIYTGTGRILGPSIFSPMAGTISVEGVEQEMLLPKHIIIATGAKPKALPHVAVDGATIGYSHHFNELQQVPQSVVIIGGGVIGVEWASLLLDLGTHVTMLEAGERILPQLDYDVVQTLTKSLKQRGLVLHTKANVERAVAEANGADVTFTVDEETQTLQAEKVLVSVGRTGNVDDIGLANTAITVNNGFIEVNEQFQTAESHLYAIGDVIGGAQLAHVAMREGILAVEAIAGVQQTERHVLIPQCIYSYPEVATIGLSEQQASEQATIRVKKVPFSAIGKAHIEGQSEGWMKCLIDEHDTVVGVHIVGPQATELISSAAVAQFMQASSWELAQVMYPHPSIGEIYSETAFALQDRAIHF